MWNYNVFVTILPILMLIVTTGQLPAAVRYLQSTHAFSTTVLGLIVSFSFTLSIYPFYALSLATNVLVTMLTGICHIVVAGCR